MQITIIACGWLGLPLGRFLVQNGHQVKGSTTKESKKYSLLDAGIIPYILNLSPAITCENFGKLIDSEVIIINIPPRVSQNGEDFHYQQIQNLAKHILNNFKEKPLPKIIFVSSTSIYPDKNQIATENTEVLENHVLVKVETLLKGSFDKLTILRLGGLMGYDRFPSKYYQNKSVANWATGVNYIHRDDAILLINNILEKNIWNETFNICSPIHPTRKEILVKNCEDLGLDWPIFTENSSHENFKIISPEKIISWTNYQFKYANPLDYFYATSGS
jgi:nucleoside-diphosphate-sugar epimerase